MCRDLDRVKEIESALGDASKHACKHKDKECKFFRVCGYQKQRSEKPHVWLIAASAIVSPKAQLSSNATH